jgi:hypothetical protein
MTAYRAQLCSKGYHGRFCERAHTRHEHGPSGPPLTGPFSMSSVLPLLRACLLPTGHSGGSSLDRDAELNTFTSHGGDLSPLGRLPPSSYVL